MLTLLCLLLGHHPGPECSRCQTFICPRCRRRVSWKLGCNDEEPDICDDCWAQKTSMPAGQRVIGSGP